MLIVQNTTTICIYLLIKINLKLNLNEIVLEYKEMIHSNIIRFPLMIHIVFRIWLNFFIMRSILLVNRDIIVHTFQNLYITIILQRLPTIEKNLYLFIQIVASVGQPL